MASWDVFISYAGEDREHVATPLAQSLQRAGLRVWFDGVEILPGKSIRECVDEGLAHSSFGVLVLSEFSMSKPWPRNEISALFTRDLNGVTRIVPVWHNVNYSQVAEFSPLLADRAALSTDMGVEFVANRILNTVMASSLTGSGLTHTRLLIELLDRDGSPQELMQFLLAQTPVLSRAFGAQSLWWSSQQQDCSVGDEDFIIGAMIPRTEPVCVVHSLFFQQPSLALCDSLGGPARHLQEHLKSIMQAVDKLKATDLRSMIRESLQAKDLSFEVSGLVVTRPILYAGRREALSDSELSLVRSINVEGGVRIRTFDWLLDACRSVDFQAY